VRTPSSGLDVPVTASSVFREAEQTSITPWWWRPRSSRLGRCWQNARVIRLARLDDVPQLQELERAAGEAFRQLEMDSVADDDPPSTEDLTARQHDGRAWVVADQDDRPIAYLLVGQVDQDAHIEQVSVHPGHARRGLGRALIDQADAWAATHGLEGLTLTTFADVPWNAPYYARLGFRTLAADEMTAGLQDIRAQEAAVGLDAWPRVTMRRSVRRST
jgi:GNAT superfamily N-acetyltransferase